MGEDGITVTGVNTSFDTQCHPGDQLVWTEGAMKGAVGAILSVDSHSRITLKKPVEGKDRGTGHGFKILPKVDQSVVMASVFERLAQNGSIGIFPEGGSHDRTELLPIKAGVSMMALGAMAATPGLNVTIVPVGINYFKGHRFRSRVFVDIGRCLHLPPARKHPRHARVRPAHTSTTCSTIHPSPPAPRACTHTHTLHSSPSTGEPIKPTAEMVAKFQSGGDDKRSACGALLEEVSAGIRSVTIQAKDYNTLQLFRAMRRLHSSNVAAEAAKAATKAAGEQINRPASFIKSFNSAPPLEKFELVKAFANGWDKIQKEPEAQALFDNVLEYRMLLRNYGVPDFRIAKADQDEAFVRQQIFGTSYLVIRTAMAVMQLFLCALFVIPGAFMSLPMFATTRYISEKEATKAVQKSSVKIAGRDVLATWKLMVAVVLVPVLHLVYTFMAFVVYGENGAVAWFFFAPFVAAVTIFSTEVGVKLFYSVIYLIKAALKPQENMGLELVAKRKALQGQVAAIVAKFGLLKGNE